jgi:hypothetical protein
MVAYADVCSLLEGILPALKKTILTSADEKELVRSVVSLSMLAQADRHVAQQISGF